MQQTANDVDQVKRSSSPYPISAFFFLSPFRCALSTEPYVAPFPSFRSLLLPSTFELYFEDPSVLTMVSYPSLQGTNYGRAFTNGFPHRTPQRTTTSHVVLDTRKRQPGFLKAASFRIGSQQDRFFGFTENVCHVPFLT
jgi:hypothetical protein